MYNLLSAYQWKVKLLTEGCRIASNISLPPAIALKKIHLYAHSNEKHHHNLPDDIVLPNQIITRFRYKSNSPLILESCISGYQIRNETTSETVPISFVPLPDFNDIKISNLPISSICSFLGTDLLGITPSNYCFYFKLGMQCKFCEILPTFKQAVEYPKTFKNLDVIEKSIITALKHDKCLRFVAITTGNIHSYDFTLDYFAQIGERLQKDPTFQQIEQLLATLMPPDDLSKISVLREKGFTKIYFPLEVFEPTHFKNVCPGKASYGYEKILQALNDAVKIFGPGNVYTNFVYGIQSLNSSLDSSSYDPEEENKFSLKAVKEMLDMSVIPAFTLYHYAGYNSIGKLELNTDYTSDFFRIWGELVQKSGIIPVNQEAVLFSPLSLSNTLFNDGYRLAKQKVQSWT